MLSAKCRAAITELESAGLTQQIRLAIDMKI